MTAISISQAYDRIFPAQQQESTIVLRVETTTQDAHASRTCSRAERNSSVFDLAVDVET